MFAVNNLNSCLSRSFVVVDNVHVEGIKPKNLDVLAEEIDNFFQSFGTLHRDEKMQYFYLDMSDEDKSIPRGPGTHTRVEVQGREGLHHVRVAFQIGKAVLAQVVLPKRTVIPISSFKDAMKRSGSEKRELIFGSTKDIVRDHNGTKKK